MQVQNNIANYSAVCTAGRRHKDGKQIKQNYCVMPGTWSEEDMSCERK